LPRKGIQGGGRGILQSSLPLGLLEKKSKPKRRILPNINSNNYYYLNKLLFFYSEHKG
jgi:hypothetical protein